MVRETRRRRGRGWIAAAWVVGALLVLGVVAFFATDGLIRSAAESVAAGEIEKNLPSGTTGSVSVKIEGGPVLLQYLGGSFVRVAVDAPTLTANGVPMAVHLVATDVPTTLSKPLPNISGTVSLTQAALNDALKVPDASALALGDGVVTYDSAQRVLGFPVSYTVTAKASVSGPDVLLTPADIHITSGPVSLDLTGVVNALLGENPASVCVADQLPAAIHLTDIDVKPSHVTVSFKGSNVLLTEAALSTKGSCG
jgi:hypothetical protein